MKGKKRKGFTLVELLVVIAILAILATVTVVGYRGFTEKANKSVDEQLCAQYNTLLKAASVEDTDISLQEFVNYIESNGINSNYFGTTSKSYKFAYYPSPEDGNNLCVLIDADTSEILYPESAKSLDVSKLWCGLGDKLVLQDNIVNYVLFNTQKFNDIKNIKEGVEYNFDLNNHVFEFDSTPNPNINIKLRRGFVVKAKGVTLPESIVPENVISDKEKVVTLEEGKIDFKTLLTNNKVAGTDAKTLSLNGNYFVNTQTSGSYNGAYVAYDSSAYEDNYDDIIFENCVFDRYYFYIDFNGKSNVTFKNCTFYNSPRYGVECLGAKSLNITGCHFIDCYRGILASPSTEETNITNNTFNLINDPSKKDHPIQLSFDSNHADFYISDWDKELAGPKDKFTLKSTNFKIVIKDNVVEKASHFINMHITSVTGKSANARVTYFNTIFVEKNFDISNNTFLPKEFEVSPGDPDKGDLNEFGKDEVAQQYYLETVLPKFNTFIK